MKKYFPLIFIYSFCCLFITNLNASKVGDIKINQKGNFDVPEDLVKYNLSLESGDDFSQDKLNKDIKRLYETGYFNDVSATTDKENGKVNITYNLKNIPRIKKIEIKGNKQFSKEKILNKIQLSSDELLDEKLLKESVKSLQKMYRDEGYHQASVYPSTTKSKDGGIILTFNIKENLRLKINEVKFKGNEVFSDRKLRNTIQSGHSYLNWVFDRGLYRHEFIKNDKLRLRNLYWSRGYLDFSIEEKTDVLKENAEFVDVIFKIDEGKQYEVSEIKIKGVNAFPKKEIKDVIRINPGEIYNINKEQESIKAIERKYSGLGYTNFNCKTELDTNYKTHTVNIIFNIHEGKSFTVRDINIRGNKITKDYVIRRELPIQPGEPVDKNMVKAGKSRLMAMNYFEEVETYNTKTNIPGQKDVNYGVEEKNTAHASIGAGYSTTNSLVGRLSLSETNFDLFDPSNFFRGGGQRINLLAQIGLVRNDISLDFTEPWLFGIPLNLDVGGFYHTRRYEYWDERHAGFDVSLSKPFMEFNRLSLGYTLDFVRLHDMDHDYSKATRDEEEGSSRLGKFRLEVERDTRDSLSVPKSGYNVSTFLETNSEILGGSSNFYKIGAEGNTYFSFLEEMLVLHLGFEAGTIGGIGGSNEVPIYQKYFLGGQYSIRGFEFRKVGPRNSNDIPTGGQTMMVATAELTHPIYKWVRGAPFVDVGNTWSDPFEVDGEFNVGAGYGFRISVPQILDVPLQIDFGYPVYRTNDNYNKGFKFYIDVGVDY